MVIRFRAALLALTALGMMVVAAVVRAAPIPDSPGDSIRVTLDRGEIRDVAYVEYMSLGTLRLVSASGRTEYAGVHRVVAIEGESGEDYTGVVITEHRHAGELPAVVAAARSRPGFRLRARPLPECTSFAITETGLLLPLRTATATDADRSVSLALDFGWMKNVRQEHALGVVAHGDVGVNRLRAGPALRYRRWYTRGAALDLEAGVLVAGSEEALNYDFDGPALLAQIDYQVEGYLALTMQAETTALTHRSPVTGETRRVGDVDVRIGAKLGSDLGLVGALGLAIPLAAIISVIANSRD
ncbi:MAG: hypothetical protein ACM3JJ_05845 [Hyphomicrobiales bacterium]